MNGLKGFIVTLVSMIILISAIELISPDNSMKKYLKFVLGTILIAVMISPIVSFINNGEKSITSDISEYIDLANGKSKDTISENRESTSETAFKVNLQENCNRILKEKFKDLEFKSEIDCKIDMEDITYSINKVEVGVKDREVSKIEKIVIKKNSESTEVSSKEKKVKNEDEIISYLAEVLNINKEQIMIYKVD